MTITICPAAFQGKRKCWNAQCRLRHDVVHCKPCKCFVLHSELRKHCRGEDHRLNSGFGEWEADTRRSAQAIRPSPYPYVPKPKPSEKRARRLAGREEKAGTGGVPARGEVTRHLSVSGEEGLDFKGVYNDKTNSTVPVIIQKTTDDVHLTLVGVVVTGAGSGGFSATENLPMKIKGKKKRAVQVSFVPTAPGEWDARLVLRFLHVSKGKRVTLAITRRLHGVATSPVATPKPPRTPEMFGDVINRTPGSGVSLSQRHQGFSGNMQLRGTRLHRNTASGRDSPRSH